MVTVFVVPVIYAMPPLAPEDAEVIVLETITIYLEVEPSRLNDPPFEAAEAPVIVELVRVIAELVLDAGAYKIDADPAVADTDVTVTELKLKSTFDRAPT